MNKKGSKLYEWQQKANSLGGKCQKCGKKTDYLTVDHIIPFAFLEMLGIRHESYDDEWNYQLLCRACNKLKGAMFDFTNPKTIENLKKYVVFVEDFYSK